MRNGHESQADRIFRILEFAQQRRFHVAAHILAEISLSYTRRIFELRQQGHNIEQIELPRVNGVRRTAYKLIKGETQ